MNADTQVLYILRQMPLLKCVRILFSEKSFGIFSYTSTVAASGKNNEGTTN